MFISNQYNGKILQYSLATPFSVNDGVTLEGEFSQTLPLLAKPLSEV